MTNSHYHPNDDFIFQGEKMEHPIIIGGLTGDYQAHTGTFDILSANVTDSKGKSIPITSTSVVYLGHWLASSVRSKPYLEAMISSGKDTLKLGGSVFSCAHLRVTQRTAHSFPSTTPRKHCCVTSNYPPKPHCNVPASLLDPYELWECSN
jgi:hypothetical protein